MNYDEYDKTKELMSVYRQLMEAAKAGLESAGPGVLEYDPRKPVLAEHQRLLFAQRDALEALEHDIELLNQSDEDTESCAVVYALRMGITAVQLYGSLSEVRALWPQRHLQPFSEAVTDQQIRDILGNSRYPTRQEQAGKLGISERSLYRRLKKLKSG